MLGAASMSGVPALGAPKTSSLVGRIAIPTFSASPLDKQSDTFGLQNALEPIHSLIDRVIASPVDKSGVLLDVLCF